MFSDQHQHGKHAGLSDRSPSSWLWTARSSYYQTPGTLPLQPRAFPGVNTQFALGGCRVACFFAHLTIQGVTIRFLTGPVKRCYGLINAYESAAVPPWTERQAGRLGHAIDVRDLCIPPGRAGGDIPIR